MGAASVTTVDVGSWRLGPGIAEDVQGIVTSGFSDLEGAEALLLEQTGSGGDWLKALGAVAPITAGTGRQAPAAAIAFTRSGLDRLGLSKEAIGTFPRAFQEGMMQADRRRRLGDAAPVRDGAVPPPKPVWSANTPLQAKETSDEHRVEDGLLTDLSVHALLLVFDMDRDGASKLADACGTALRAAGVRVVRRRRLELHADGRGIPREHFGFSDGVSQPIPFGEGVTTKAGAPYPRDPLHGVPLGEVLMGYPNAHGDSPPRPAVADPRLDGTDERGMPGAAERLAAAAKLREVGAAGLRDLGLNGSFLVVRELAQDVFAFWESLDREAEVLTERNPGAPVTAEALATKVVGRDKLGNVLRPRGPLPSLRDGTPDNAFGYLRDDRLGDGCPIGAHVRRANPRDALAARDEDAATLLQAANSHRILRRGRKYGALARDPRQRDDVDRGLLFLALNTDIERQFEFIQQNWLLNPNFGTLRGQVDPLVGPAGPMTLPADPLRRLVEVETFVTLRGGDYFFLPSLPALAYLASLPPSREPRREVSP